jgi:hypothetical protein
MITSPCVPLGRAPTPRTSLPMLTIEDLLTFANRDTFRPWPRRPSTHRAVAMPHPTRSRRHRNGSRHLITHGGCVEAR